MSQQTEKDAVDEIVDGVMGYVKEKNFNEDCLVAAFCHMYCQIAADHKVRPEFFLRATMSMFAMLAGGEFVFVGEDEMEGMSQKEGATLQ